ncbi:MAG: hypothetical protein AAGF12_05455 [Myxococcota bacterium]
MSEKASKFGKTGNRVVRFAVSSALIVAPLAVTACGGAQNEGSNVEHVNEGPEGANLHSNEGPVEEHSNTAQEEDMGGEMDETSGGEISE